ncbi:MAG TPA: carboxypeptidase regulatory-like domain-containing protein [Abditibacteriaceae bacterium]
MLRVLWLFFFLLAIAVDCFAQPLPDRRELRGRVSMTQNKPILGAKIQISRKDTNGVAAFWGAAVNSDVSGEFCIHQVEDGDYIVLVTAPGYETWRDEYQLTPYSPPLRIVLQRQVSLIFTILDANGIPVKRRRASIMGFVAPPGEWKSSEAKATPLGDSYPGNLPGETYMKRSEGIYYKFYVWVLGAGYGIWKGKVQVLEGGTAKFTVRLQKSITKLQVRVVETSADKTSQPRPLGATQISLLSIKTTDPEGETLARWLFKQQHPLSRDGSGTILFSDLLPGRYQFQISPPLKCHYRQLNSESGIKAATKTSVEIGDTAKELLFRFPACPVATPSLEITLRDAQGHPLANRDFSFFCIPHDEITGAPLSTETMDAREIPYQAMRSARTDDNGRISLYPFWPAKWSVQIYEIYAFVRMYGLADVVVTEAGGKATMHLALEASPNRY